MSSVTYVIVAAPAAAAGVRAVAVVCARAGCQPRAALLTAPGDVLQGDETPVCQHLELRDRDSWCDGHTECRAIIDTHDLEADKAAIC